MKFPTITIDAFPDSDAPAAYLAVHERGGRQTVVGTMALGPGIYGLIRQAEGATLTAEWMDWCVTHRRWMLPFEKVCPDSGPDVIQRVLLVRGAAEGTPE